MSRSLSAVEFPSLAKRDSFASPRLDIRPLQTSVSTPGNKELLGLCMPLDLSALFQVGQRSLERNQTKWIDGNFKSKKARLRLSEKQNG